ncbi:sulfotransferase family protein [Allorhizobium sp. BGMRC 0089]|uniref:sulfotransferase family 2 domain-containing protein n=1 Tax=Allorhizobium sonneratiae TaxID=2934936 RepID=UPI002033BDF0|nr:sulfotransferase family 2 domain-containing protein [Allorhizobium sonneratiae]MCM2291260.1 sulfotransferase family protein [Allorhizobium sonneratiae]
MTVITDDYIFIHVPKTAGRAITKRLGGESDAVPTHLPYHRLSDFNIASPFTFGFVRNPWDRLVSLYSFMCQKPLQSYESPLYQQHIRDIGFKAWLLDDGFFMKQDEHWQCESLQPMQRRSQMFWLEGCDFIGRVETINDDFIRLRKQLGLKPRLAEWFGLPALSRKNASKRGAYRDYYDSRSIDFVAEHFAAEIDRFGYRFDA